jgi:hypothetical protein
MSLILDNEHLRMYPVTYYTDTMYFSEKFQFLPTTFPSEPNKIFGVLVVFLFKLKKYGSLLAVNFHQLINVNFEISIAM